MLLAISLPALFVGYVLSNRASLQAEFPLQSIAHRLEYEDRAARRRTPQTPPSAEPLPQEIDERLKHQAHPGGRWFQLAYLHNASSDDFIASQGFGITRMPIRIRRERILLPPAAPVTLPPAPYIPESTTQPPDLPLADGQSGSAPNKESLLALHDAGAWDFLDPNRTGFAEDRDHVAGFFSHAFTQVPAATDWPGMQAWQIVKLELVSLLKHDEPRVYLSKTLPQMDQLIDAPTRALDQFELRSLPRLRRQEDLVIDESPRQIRMLGALRAGEECRNCHTVDYGQLLGAFSYELVPLQPPAPDKATEGPPAA
jgi:hypothetical protein